MYQTSIISKISHKNLESGIKSEYALKENSVVLIECSVQDISKIEKVGHDLVVYFRDGSVIKIIDYYNTADGSNNSLVFKEGNGQLLWIQNLENLEVIDKQIAYQVLEDLEPLLQHDSSFNGAFPWLIGAGAAAGVGAVAAAISNNSSDDDDATDTVAPLAPIVDQNNGGGLSGTAEPGSVIVVKDKDGNIIGETTTDDQGNWSIDPNPIADGESGTVTATDGAGNTSPPTDTGVTDKTAPDAPIVKDNNAAGLSGTAEPDSKIVVKDKDGNVIGETTTDDHGNWSIDPNPIADGESGTVTATDGAGNTSPSTDTGITDKTAPDAPIVKDNNAAGLSGTAEPHSVIKVIDKDGKEIGTTTTDASGNWSITPNPLAEGESGKVTATDAAGNISLPTIIGEADITAPDAPIVETNNAAGLSGTAEPHSVIKVVDKDGKEIGTTTTDASGNWSITPNPLAEGESGKVTATDAAGNISDPTTTTAADLTPPTAPVIKDNNSGGLTGTAEPDSKIVVKDKDGNIIGETTTDDQGNWSIDPNPIADGESGTVTATDGAGNTSPPTDTDVTDTTPPTAPVIKDNNSGGLTGTAEPDSKIVVKDKDGNVIGETTTDDQGNWSIDPNPIADGESGTVTATDGAGNTSPPTDTGITDLTPPTAPVIKDNNSGGLTGTAEPDSKIVVKDKDGNIIGETTTDDQGNWSIDPNPIADGESGTVTATDGAGNTSPPTDTGITDTTPPTAPVIKDNNSGGLIGTAEPDSKIVVKDKDGNIIGETTTDDQGNWSIDPNPIADGESGTVTATDGAGNTSPPTDTGITDTTPPTAPVIKDNNSGGLIGTAEPDSKIVVKDKDGNIIGETTTDDQGNWSIDPNPIADGESGTVTATDGAGNTSPPTDTGVTDKTAPDAPIVKDNNAAGLSGTAEPNSVIKVVDKDGKEIGTTTTDASGNWSITPNPLADGESGKVTATDAAGNTSLPTIIGEADITAPDAPIVATNNAAGLTGTAEPNSVIKVVDKEGKEIGTTTTDASGNWSITPNPLAEGEVGKVTATDAAGNISDPTTTTAADLTAPDAPIVETNNAAGLSGTAEPHSVIKVVDKDGKEIGTTTTDASGNWSITPNPLADGESGKVTATDAAGNISDPTTTTAADLTPPTAPVIKDNNNGGLTGTAEPDSKIVVKDKDGNIIGETTTDDQGNWSIDPNPIADGESGTVTATDGAGNTSPPTDTGVTDLTPPTAPVIKDNNSGGLTGTAEPDSKIVVKDKDGNIIGETTTDDKGNWSIDPNPLAEGEVGKVTATDAAGNISDPTTTTAADLTAPDAPIVATNNAAGLSGTAEPNSVIKVVDKDGKEIGTTTTDASGNWSITPNPLAEGEVGKVTATDAAGNISDPTTTTAADLTPPTAPVIKDNNSGGLTGTAEPDSKIVVKDKDGNIIGETTTDDQGNWSIDPNPIADGESGTVTATDGAGNTSPPTDTGITDKTPPTAPVIKDNNSGGLTGTAEPDSKIVVKDKDGNVIGETTTDDQGNWSIDPNPIADGESGTVTATDGAGNTSPPTDTGITDKTAPDAPIVKDNNAAGLTGTAEPNSVIKVVDKDGKEIGTTTTDASGNWSITPNPLADGESGKVTATDAAGNTSSATDTGIADLVAPTTPAVEVNTVATLSGLAEAGAIITITNSTGQKVTTVVDATGHWSISPNPLVDGETGTVTATDAAGNQSDPLTIKLDAYVLADTVISTSGVTNDDTPTIKGTAEPNSTVTLTFTSATDSLVFTTTVNASGEWSYTPSTALAEGSYTLTAIAKDAEGRESQPGSSSITIDITPPSADLVIKITAITADTGIDGDFITSDKAPTIHGTLAGTLAAGEHAQISIDNGLTWLNLTVNNGIWSYKELRSLGDGVYNYKVRVVDDAGNVGSTHNQDVTILTKAPDNTISVNTLFTADTTPTITGSFTKALATGEKIQITVNGITYTQGDGNLTVNTAAKTWSLKIPNRNALNVDGATDQLYDVHAQIINAVGNSVSDSSNNELTVYRDVSISAGPSPDYMDQQPLFNGQAKLGAGEKLIVTIYDSEGYLVGYFSSERGPNAVTGLVLDAVKGTWKITAANWGDTQLEGGKHTVKAVVEVADGSGGQESAVQEIVVKEPKVVDIPNKATDSDINAKVYALADGGYYIFWAQNTNGRVASAVSNYDIVAQRYTATGEKYGNLIKVTNTPTGTALNSEGYADRNDMWDNAGSYSVAVNADASFTIAYNYNLATRSTIKTFNQWGMEVSSSNVKGASYYFGYNYVETTNGKVVVFTSGTVHDYNIYLTGSTNDYATSIKLTNGSHAGNGYIYQQFNTPTGTVSGVARDSTNSESVSAVSLGGSLVLVQYANFSTVENTPTKQNLMVVDYSATGTATVKTSIVANMDDRGWQLGASSFVLKEGGFVSLWAGNQSSATTALTPGTMDGFDVYSRRFEYDVRTNSINPIDIMEKRVNTTTSGVNGVGFSTLSTGHFSGAALAQGGYVVVWTKMLSNSQSEVYSQSYDAAGNKIGGETLVSTQTVDGPGTINLLPSVTALGDGGYVVTWTNVTGTDYRVNSTTADIKAVTVNGDGTIRGADELHVNGANYYDGIGKLVGTDAVNTLDGRNGASEMIGGKDNDNIIISGTNFSKIDGGAGTDILIWDADDNLNLGSILNKVKNIEVINLGDKYDNTLTVSINDLLQITSNNTLVVQGGDTDSVKITDSSKWVSGGTQTYHGSEYYIYTAVSADNQLVNLWIQDNLTVI